MTTALGNVTKHLPVIIVSGRWKGSLHSGRAETLNFLFDDWPDGAGRGAGRAWVGDFPFQPGGSRGGPDSWERCSRGGGGGQEMNGAAGGILWSGSGGRGCATGGRAGGGRGTVRGAAAAQPPWSAGTGSSFRVGRLVAGGARASAGCASPLAPRPLAALVREARTSPLSESGDESPQSKAAAPRGPHGYFSAAHHSLPPRGAPSSWLPRVALKMDNTRSQMVNNYSDMESTCLKMLRTCSQMLRTC